ncbi:MAG: gamma-glutamyl-gamma-aminobutyrate hydrolase family protein [Frankiales bacterium]|nr:gamma-glutamyl-gamma-aminobutyrate hydrolase family protein [Frankiales bacterium]
MHRQTYDARVTPSPSPPTPRIGLTTYRESAAWGVWNESADLLPTSYAQAVANAGGVPFLLPPTSTDLEHAAATSLDGLHGLVLTGGPDVDPSRYAAAPHEQTGAPRTERDDWETCLAHAALGRAMPVLAICRGMQVLNVALGGDLVQHLPDVVGTDEHRPTVGRHGTHDVRLATGSRVGELLGDDKSVPTYHHQAVHNLGAGLVATAWAADGTIEALEHSGSDWVVAVQWHPEVRDGAPLFAGFVAAAASYGIRASAASP